MMDNVREKLAELLEENPFIIRPRCDVWQEAADWLLDHGVTVQQWIPVTQRRPDKELAAEKAAGGHVYGCLMRVRSTMFPTRTFTTAGFYEQGFYTRDESPRFLDATAEDVTDLVTHWMPKPTPPKGE